MRIKPILIIFIYFIAILFPSILSSFLQQGSEDGFIAVAGMLIGMTGLMIVFFQFIISARIKWVDRLFGYNEVINFHRIMGETAFYFILFHLALVTLAEEEWNMLISFNVDWYINLGKLAFLILVVQILSSVYRKKIKLTYEKWRMFHDVFAVTVLVLMFIHSFFAGDDLKLLPLRIIWFILPLVGIMFLLWQRVFLFKLAPKYIIKEIIKKADNVHTIHFAPENGKTPFAHKPGQFHFIKFSDCDQLKNEEHPFTISSSPSQKSHLASTIKASGDFTNKVHQLKKGDRVRIIGPFGKLTFVEKRPVNSIVFVAGGIGITPFMSMLQYMTDLNHQHEVMLFYFNRTELDIVFREELDELVAKTTLKLKVIHVLSKQELWDGEKGYFSQKLVEKHGPDTPRNSHWYVCGPPSMSEAVITELKELQIPPRNIFNEMFGFAKSGTSSTYQKKQVRLLVWYMVALFVILIILMAGMRSNWRI